MVCKLYSEFIGKRVRSTVMEINLALKETLQVAKIEN